MRLWNSIRNYKEILIFLLILLLFTPFYIDMILSLPLFGDATIHGSVTKSLINNGIQQTPTAYPLLYNEYQAILYSFFNEIGMNIIVVVGLVFIFISIFLLVKEVTGKSSVGFLSMIIVSASSKLIYYSARMYMEILLSAFIIFTIYLLMRYVKTRSMTDLILLALFTGITASIKQQGLFILFISILLLFLLNSAMNIKTFNKNGFIQSIRHITIFLLIFGMIISPFYFLLYHNNGKIIPGNEDYKIIQWTNQIGQKICDYQKPLPYNEFDEIFTQRIQEIKSEKQPVGAILSESRHIRSSDVLTSHETFYKLHGLYLEKFKWGSTSKVLSKIMEFTIYFGMILFILNIFLKNKVLFFGNWPIQKQMFLFLLIFLPINYFLFERNTDQLRYHLFIAIIFSVFTAISIYFICNSIITRQKIYKPIRIISVIIILIYLLVPLITLVYQDSEINKRYYRSQIYSSSKGGIASIQEVGTWINEYTNENDLIWQNCGNELKYYSERKVTGGYYYYFLNQSELFEFFPDRGIKYIVIYDSQIVPDKKWTNLCWVPKSFVNNITDLYPIAYTSSYDDINVYYVEDGILSSQDS